MGKNLYNLTSPQKAILYTEQFYKNTTVNNICGTVLIKQKINFEKLINAIHIFLKENDSFRIRLTLNDKQEYKQYFSNDYILDSNPIILLNSYDDLLLLENKIASIPFSLVDSQLFKIQLFRFKDNSGGFIVNAHHLVADACTASLVASKIITIYSSLVQGINSTDSPTSYINYINSEKSYFSDAKFKKDKEYWEEIFSTNYEVASIPSIKDENTVSCRANRKSFTISNSNMKLINEFCSKYKISVFNFFMGIYAIYISKVTSLEKFIIGTPILNRSNFVEKNTPGMFISTLPFKFFIDKNYSFIDLCKNIAFDALSMFRHQKYPYENILEYIRKNNPSQPNLYDILISYQNTKTNRNSSDIDYEVRWTFNKNVADSMQIHLFDMNDEGILNIAYDYRMNKYTQEDIVRLHNRICYIISQLLSSNNLLIKDIEIITPEEKNFILNDFNNTYMDYNKTLTVIDLFEKQVKKNPNNIALIFEDHSFTYKELNKKANQLAYYLLDNGIKAKDVVGIMIHRSSEMIIAILAVLKLGATYLPIDPEYPIERINYMLEDSHSKTILVHSATLNLNIGDNYTKINVDINSDFYNNQNTNNLNTKINPKDLIYLIYTSGSTGKPKGVMITHQNITNFILGEKQYINFSKSKVMVSVTTICFDIFALEIWGALTSGIKLVLASDVEQVSPFKLKELCEKNNVTMIQTTPSRYSAILADIDKDDDFWNIFSDIMVGGEPFPKLLLQKLRTNVHANIFNMYGPTETTVWSTIKDLTKSSKITVGIPIANTTCYILDKDMNILPPGVPGELYIGGDGVCPGYWNRDELTNDKFKPSPFKTGETIYNTNDLAYIDYNGEIVHLGRTDFQVKIRGYRIELEEIQTKILGFHGIKDAVVLAKDNKFLVCYYVANKECNFSEITSYLLESLPNYMIPAYFIKIPSIPLTPNGKLNRNLLPEIPSEEQNIEGPSTKTEKQLAEVITNILGKKKLNINSSFLDLGLDSLNIIKAQTMLLKYNYVLTTQDFYKYPTIKKLSQRIDANISNFDEQDVQIPKQFKHTNANLEEALNNINIDDDTLGNVFLTGSNGFVGIHVLYELLNTTNNTIYCLVRGRSYEHSLERLTKAYKFYFNTDISKYINDRVIVVSGDVTLPNFGIDISVFNTYINKFSTIIHTAAIVKHYGSFSDFEKININGTKSISAFAFAYKKRLIHISSISVSGNYLVKQCNRNVTFSENTLYIGQHYTDNVYVNSKFESEKIVLSYMEKGLIAQIHRIGILSARYSDGMFQEKIYENAFYNRLKSMVQIGAVTDSMLPQMIEFTPIDYCAGAIVLLAKQSACNNKIYNLYNPNLVSIKDLIVSFKKSNVLISILSEKEFDERLHMLSSESDSSLSYIINDVTYNSNHLLTLNYDYTVHIKSDFTQKYLEKLNFKWPYPDSDYIKKLLDYMKKTHFIN